MMIPWLHFTGGDNLYFKSLHPSSKGAIAGACLVLILLALFERWVAGLRAGLEARWRERALAIVSGQSSDRESCEEAEKVIEVDNQARTQTSSRTLKSVRVIAPFIASHDIPRGAIHAFQALLGYALMLAVMTFHAAYLISIVVGLGIGEMLFGRTGHSYSPHVY